MEGNESSEAHAVIFTAPRTSFRARIHVESAIRTGRKKKDKRIENAKRRRVSVAYAETKAGSSAPTIPTSAHAPIFHFALFDDAGNRLSPIVFVVSFENIKNAAGSQMNLRSNSAAEGVTAFHLHQRES